MRKRFLFEREDRPGEAWLARFRSGRREAEQWYVGTNRAELPSAEECRAALSASMPELLPHYDHVCELVGDDEVAHQTLSHYRPPPLASGCSQAVWIGDGGPALVRNYDWDLNGVSGRFELTNWAGRMVISKAQRPWGGCIDGMNENGLVAGLTFVADDGDQPGFSIILIMRYVLETCRNVREAIEAFYRVPVAMSHNVTVLDGSGEFATLYLKPHCQSLVTFTRVCTNHQEDTENRFDSIERQQFIFDLLDDPGMTLDELISKFQKPPLCSRSEDSTTVYTVVYRPNDGSAEYLWPEGKRIKQGFKSFTPLQYEHDYGDLSA